MYHPYFRGKQYELITIRENAKLIAQAKFTPIIEPVKQALGGLSKAAGAMCDAEGQAVVIVNPYHGDHAEGGDGISALLKSEFKNSRTISAGILLKKSMSADDAMKCVEQHRDHDLTLIHAGFLDAKGIIERLDRDLEKMRHVFFERDCGKLYRRHFGGYRTLLRDGFVRRRNRDHPPVEKFSDLHVTFPDEGMDGFGDFLIAGDEFSEGGGPAYAVAIHLTYIDPDRDDEMFIKHFVSTSVDTPTDPAGKFAQALRALIASLNSEGSRILQTEAVLEFRELHEKKHFPGLGYVKKLSMQHHIETMSAFFKK